MEQQTKKIKGITFTKKDGTKGIISIKAIIYTLLACAFLGTGMVLTFNQSPPNSHIITHTMWLMFAALLAGYFGATCYIMALFLMQKNNPKKESGQVGGSIEQTTNPKRS